MTTASVTPNTAIPAGFEIEPQSTAIPIPDGFEIEPQQFTANVRTTGDLSAPASLEIPNAGAQMRQDALSKIPPQLRGFTPAEAAQRSDVSNPMTPIRALSPSDVQNTPYYSGAQGIAQGTEQMAEPGLSNKAGGASKILRGGMEMTAPAALTAGAIVAPLATVAGVGGGMLAQKGAEAGLKDLGVPEDYANLAGDVAGLVAGGAVGHAAGKFSGEAPKPNQVERVSPATPNPPTAAIPTVPESPDTINLQMQQLGTGQRRAVMLPKGTTAPDTYPSGTAITHDQFGNVYVFRPDLIKRSEIHRAAKNNNLPEVLGSSDMGMGAPDKSQLPPDAPVVVARAPDGTEAQSTATDETSLPTAIEAARRVTPPGGSLSVESPDQILDERTNDPGPASSTTPPVPAPTQSLAPQPNDNAVFTPPPVDAWQPQGISNAQDNVTNNGIAGPTALPGRSSDSGNAAPIPEGNGPGYVRGLSEPGVGALGNGEPQSVPGNQGDSVRGANPPIRRVTGTLDVPLNSTGVREAADVAERIQGQPTSVSASPRERSIQSAQMVSPSVTARKSLDAWSLGDLEGQPLKDVAGDVRELVQNPDDLPAYGPSGERPESFNQFRTRFLADAQRQRGEWQPGDKPLNETHGRNIGLLQAWADNGSPRDLSINTARMEREIDGPPTGDLFRLDPKSGKLSAVENMDQDGIYYARHGATEFSQPDAGRNTSTPVARDHSIVLGSGLGALQPATELAGKAIGQFGREEVLPQAAALLNGAKDTVQSFVHFLNPRSGVPPETLDQIYKMKGGRDAAQFLISAQLDKWGSRFDHMSQGEMTDFIDRQKTGRPQSDQELQQLSEFLRKADDAVYQELIKYKPSLNYLENHFRVLWKELPNARAGRHGFWGNGRRPLEGSKGMLKQHTLTTMSEGIAAGGVPYSYNPIKMFQAHYADAMKFITAHRLWDNFKDTGVRVFVKSSGNAPDGYVKVNDKISHVYFPTDQGMVHGGEWWVQDGAARLLNNFLSRDLIREQWFGRALMGVKNASTAIELGLSPFHAVFEGNEAIGSQIGIGLRRIWNLGIRNRDLGAIRTGVKEIATAPKAAVGTAMFGSKAKAAFGNFDEFSKSADGRAWLKTNPDVLEGVQAFFDGGGQIGMSRDYKIKAINNFREYWNSADANNNPGHYISLAIRSVPAFNQAIMSPLFEHYIPNLKLGFFLKEYALAKAEYSDRLASGEMTDTQIARQVLDSVENRFGEMNFDNLFWNRTFKTATQLLLRSVTWKLGNIRADIGAATGQFGELSRAVKNGELPMLHPNMAWFLGMTTWTAVLGSIIHSLGTGQLPQQLKDFVYPMIDGAAGIRVSIPTYWRDIMHLSHSPGGYVRSSLSGDIGRIADVWENKNFYGTQVWNPDDPLSRRGLDIVSHLLPIPFSLSSQRQARQQGGSAAAQLAGFAGFTKAPRYIEQSNAEQLAYEYRARHQEVGARTSQQAARSQAIAGISSILRRGGNASSEIQDAIGKGLLSQRDIPRIRQQAQIPPIQREIEGLSLTEKLNVYEAATPQERAQIAHRIRVSVAGARAKPWEWTPRAVELSGKYFGIRPIPLRVSGDLATPRGFQ